MRNATHNLKRLEMIGSIGTMMLPAAGKKFIFILQIVMFARNGFVIASSIRNRLLDYRQRRCAAGSLVTVNVQPTTQE